MIEQVPSRLDELRAEHRALDAAIGGAIAGREADQLHVARLKRDRLRLRDEIARIEDGLIPDIIA